MKLIAPNSIITSLVFTSNPEASPLDLAKEAANLASYVCNPHLFKDGLTLRGSIKETDDLTPATIRVTLNRVKLDHKAPIWKNISKIVVEAEDATGRKITFVPQEGGFVKYTGLNRAQAERNNQPVPEFDYAL